ncbi:MAG: hypothetical protein R2784_20310 [Saprospiraceae bacterium]
METYQKKSFWKKPEGVTGMIFLAALIVGGGFLLFNIIPFLTIILENTLYLAVGLVGSLVLSFT